METDEKKSGLRIATSENTAKILAGWKSNLEAEFPGIRVSYPELIGWAVKKIGPDLSKKNQLMIRDQFFDEVRQLEWLLSKAKAAKTHGESFALSDILKSEPKRPTTKCGEPQKAS